MKEKKINKLNVFKNKPGVTFIELSVVIAIIGIMTAVSLVSLQESRNQATLESEMRKISAILHSLQNYALSGKDSCTGCPNNRYVFSHGDLDSDSKPLEYRVISPKNESTDYMLEGGVEFVSSNNIFFEIPWAENNFNGDRRVALRKGSLLAVVCVYDYGKIEEIMGTAFCP